MGNLSVVFPAVVMLGIAALAVWRWQSRKQARELFIAFCIASGWNYSATKNALATRFTLPPFGVGDQRSAQHVVSGVVDERAFECFEYSYSVERRDSKGMSRNEVKRFDVLALSLLGHLPTLTVLPETMVDRLGFSTGLTTDIGLESEEFNRTFTVEGPARFASDVLTPRTMEILVKSPTCSWRIEGSSIVTWQPEPFTPATMLVRLRTLSAIAEGIPDFVWRDRGIQPPQRPLMPWNNGEL